MRHIDLTHKNPDGTIDHADESVSPARLKYPFTFQQFPTTPPWLPDSDLFIANKLYGDEQADAARAAYVGTVPIVIHPSTPGVWEDVDLSMFIPEGATSVEIVHVNSSPTDTLLAGSRYGAIPGNRWAGLAPLKQATWTTRLRATRAIQTYAQSIHIYFFVIGYWT